MGDMMKKRLDVTMAERGLASSRSQAENIIRLGEVKVEAKVVTKPGFLIYPAADIRLSSSQRYVSRAGLKLASVADVLNLDFAGKVVLDVGSSTGGFTDYALQHGASQVYAVDVGTNQLHPSLQGDSRIELHEKTDIRDFQIADKPGITVIDVSFISLRQILPHLASHLTSKQTQIIAMLKPQFEAGKQQVNKGVIKNESIRRAILRDFEAWAKQYFVIQDKRDSQVTGAKGNRERFYLLTPTSSR